MTTGAFHYARAVIDLHRILTYEEIGRACNGRSKSRVYAWRMGALPSHPDGEALKALYLTHYPILPAATV